MKKQASKNDIYFNRNNRYPGFTMVEVIAAIAIMSTSFLAIFSTARSYSMASDRNRKLTRAVLIAETLLNEQMLNKQIAYQTSQGQIDEYNWKIKISQTDIENLAKIEVVVSFKQQSSDKQYQLLSFLYIKPQTIN